MYYAGLVSIFGDLEGACLSRKSSGESFATTSIVVVQNTLCQYFRIVGEIIVSIFRMIRMEGVKASDIDLDAIIKESEDMADLIKKKQVG